MLCNIKIDQVSFDKLLSFGFYIYFTLFNSQETDIESPEGHPMLNNFVYLK